MLPTKFRSIWPSCVRVEDFQKSTNQKQEMPVAAMIVNGSGQNEHSLQRTFHRCFLPTFGSFGKAVSEEKIFLEINHSETRIVCGGHVDKMSNLYKMTFHRCFLPSFGSFVHAVSEEKIFRNRPIRNNNRMWWPCLSMDRDGMSNLYRGPSIDASYQVADQLAMWFQGRRFLEIAQSETRITCGSHVC